MKPIRILLGALALILSATVCYSKWKVKDGPEYPTLTTPAANMWLSVHDDTGGGAGATKNYELTGLLDRSQHTGTQTLSTISDAGALAALGAVGSVQITDGAIINADLADGTLRADKVAASQFNFYDARAYGLAGFALTRSVTTVPSTSTGISGATYNAATGTVFLVRNVSGAGGSIYEVTEDGAVLRTITNVNFIDTEAIEWIGWDAANSVDVFLVAEEDHTTAASEGRLTLCRLARGATTLDRTGTGNVSANSAYGGGTMNNLCVEAVAYDPRRGTIYYTSEKQTTAGSDNTPGTGAAKIFTRTVTATGTMSFGTESTLCSINPLFSGTLTDVSDMSYDPNTDTLLLVSDESDKVVRINRSGTLLEQVATPATQPEGLAMHPNGTRMFVAGEPQEFQRYDLLWGAPAVLNNIGGSLSVTKGGTGSEAAITALDIDWAAAAVFTKTLAANSTFTFSNPSNGRVIRVALTNTAGNYTVTWPAVSWSGGVVPTQTVGAKTDIYTFRRINGTTYGSVEPNF
jgi:uncharacterized protein YjiK